MKNLCVVYKGALRKVIGCSSIGPNYPVTAMCDTKFDTEEIASNVMFVKEGNLFCDVDTKKLYSELNYESKPGDICVSFMKHPKQLKKVKNR